ncbi:MAG: alpha/beta fold hydrolase, partial [Pseudomonadales bacterium]
MAYLKVGDLAFWYELAGEGPPLLFISGTGGDLRVRPNVLDGPLPRQFQVLAYDQRGLGQSSKPAGSYSMADYAEDAAALLSALGWGPVPVVGVSFGGMVAQELA